MINIRNILLLTVAVLLGCASAPLLPPIDESSFIKITQNESWWKEYKKERLKRDVWQLEGGFKTNDPKAIVSGLNFNWLEEKGNTQVYYFTTTFGVQVASINYNEKGNELTLILGGDYYDATKSRQELANRGLSAPLELIRFWIRGIPDPSYPSLVWVNSDKTLAMIEQSGVKVYFTKFLESGLPSEFFMVDEKTGLVIAMYVYEYYED